jgi:hypothetical protein
MVRVLLCGEGATDQGRNIYRNGNYIQSDGVLQILMRKFTTGTELFFVVKSRKDIKNIKLIPNRKYDINTAASKKIALLANNEHCPHVAYHRDEDNNGFDEMYSQIQSYFVLAERRGLKCIAIVPMHMTESWLLSDSAAYPSALISPKLPAKPEKLWGNKNTDGHPKMCINNILKQFHLEASTDTLNDIAEASDLNVMKARCPVSFGQFYNDMQDYV